MSINGSDFQGISIKDVDSALSAYANEIDTNNDNKISKSELEAFKEKHPDIDVSSAEDMLQEYSSISDDEDEESEEIAEESKNTYIKISDLEGVDLAKFIQMSTSKENDEITGKFWEALSDYDLSKLFSLIDTNNDNILSEEELTKLSITDGIEDTLSLFDMEELINTINEEEEENDSTTEESSAPQVSGTSGGSGTRGTSSSGGSTRSNSINNNANNTNNNNDVNQTEIDEKTRLTNNLTSANTAFGEAKTKYENLLDGNIEDASVQDKKDEMDSAYDAWQEQLSKEDLELSQNIDAAKAEVDSLNAEISQNEKEIFNNEINLSECTTAYESAVSYREGLESKKSELQSSLSGLDSSDPVNASRIETYKNKISAIETEITQAKREEELAKQAKEKAQDDLNKSKETNAALLLQLGEKEAILSGYMADAQTLSANNPDLLNLQKTYEDKKTAYEGALADYKDELKTNATQKHDDVTKSQELLLDYTNNEKISEFDVNDERDEKFAEVFNKYLLEGASDSSKSDCGGAVRRALHKTIKELYGESAASVFKEGYWVTGGDWDDQYLSNCPFFTDITDLYSESELETMIESGQLTGAIINYEPYSGSKSGHVEGVTTKGLTSDYTRPHSYFRSKSSLGKAAYHVYIPRVASQDEIIEYLQLMETRQATYVSPIK